MHQFYEPDPIFQNVDPELGAKCAKEWDAFCLDSLHKSLEQKFLSRSWIYPEWIHWDAVCFRN
jgi:hypothetical protein